MSKFEVGDLVRVKNWDEMEREFGRDGLGIPCNENVRFVVNMEYLCGEVFEIQDVCKNDCAGVDEYAVGVEAFRKETRSLEGEYWIITAEMIEHVDDDRLCDDDVDPESFAAMIFGG